MHRKATLVSGVDVQGAFRSAKTGESDMCEQKNLYVKEIQKKVELKNLEVSSNPKDGPTRGPDPGSRYDHIRKSRVCSVLTGLEMSLTSLLHEPVLTIGKSYMMKRNIFLLVLVFSMTSTASQESEAAIIASFSAINATSNTASGTLGTVGFDISVDTLRSTTFSGSGVRGGVVGGNLTYASEILVGLTDPTSVFDQSHFTPRIPNGDRVDVAASSDYRITFSQQVTDVTLLLAGLDDNEFTFYADDNPIPIDLVSSDGDFTFTSGSNSIEGFFDDNSSPSGISSANGSLRFTGTYSSLSWTSNASNIGDGVTIQLAQTSVVPEPHSLAIFLIGTLAMLVGIRRRRVETQK